MVSEGGVSKHLFFIVGIIRIKNRLFLIENTYQATKNESEQGKCPLHKERKIEKETNENLQRYY